MVKLLMLQAIGKNDMANESEAYSEIYEREYCDVGNSQHDPETVTVLPRR